MVSPRTAPKGVLNLYRSYSFIDKDPAIDKIRTIIADEGVRLRELQYLSNVAESTMKNWLVGDTKRPQHATLAAVAAALGYDWTLTKKKTYDYGKEIPKARKEWQTAHSGKSNGSRRKRK